jgi:hypothetical protein
MRRLAPLLLLTLAAAAPADERSFLVTGFDRLRVEGPIEVEVATGSPAATATGERRALDALLVRVDAGTMVVRPGNDGSGVPRVRVTVPALRGVFVNGSGRVRIAAARGSRVDLSLNGAGTLDVGDVAAGDLNVTLTGGGTMSLAGKAERARVRSYGAGSVDAARLTAGEATLVSESSGDIGVTARYSARATALGTGTIRIGGKPECRVSGPGPIECGGTMQRD